MLKEYHTHRILVHNHILYFLSGHQLTMNNCICQFPECSTSATTWVRGATRGSIPNSGWHGCLLQLCFLWSPRYTMRWPWSPLLQELLYWRINRFRLRDWPVHLHGPSQLSPLTNKVCLKKALSHYSTKMNMCTKLIYNMVYITLSHKYISLSKFF